MKTEYRNNVRLPQIDAELATFELARQTARPQRGWLRAVREALGISQQDVAKKLKIKQQGIVKFEKAEAEDRITLGNLRRVAEALECELVYAIVPKSGTLTELAERKARSEVRERVQSVEHSMALENQAVGGVEAMIDLETKRAIKKS